ncbi:MAG: T9SS type A sorting domain-containing protein [Bacteroidales bacterium]
MRKRIKIVFFLMFTALAGNAQTVLFSEDFGSLFNSFYPSTNWDCKHSSASSYNSSGGPCYSSGDYNYSLNGFGVYITTKEITLGASGNEVSFDYSFDYSVSNPEVRVSTNALCGSSGTDITGGLAETSTCDNVSFNLDAYANQTIRLIFYSNTSSENFYFDNVEVITGGGGGGGGTVLYEEDFSTTSLALASNTGWSRNWGTTYACTGGDYAYYSSSSTNYFATDAFHVPRGKGVDITFDMKRSSGSYKLELYARVGGYDDFNTSSEYYSGWMQLSTSHLSYATSCSNFTVTVPGEICGGQDLSVLFLATGTNITIDNIEITDNSAKATVPDISSSPLTYNFDGSTDFYGPVSFDQFDPSATGNKFSYHSRYGCDNATGAYAYISSTGGNGGQVGQGSVSGGYAYINKESADCEDPAPDNIPSIITREFNTANCSGTSATLRFAFKASYSGYTYDEGYTLSCPEIYYHQTTDGSTTGYNWTQCNVNYYFPDENWWYATTDLPKAENLIVAFAANSIDFDYFDDIKILCDDCDINDESGGDISCTSDPGLTDYQPNTEYTFTIAATSYATHYKWIIRDLTTSDIYYGTTAGADPAVVSGQGTQNATINFGTTAGTSFRVMCIPYDGYYGTDASPTDACYAKISYYQSLSEAPAPVSWLQFDAYCYQNKTVLFWSTASETGNDHFVVQSSDDASEFHDIGIVNGAGSSAIRHDYEFTVEKPELKGTYFRIKQVDFDGQYDYSEVIQMDCENDYSLDFEVYPNPIEGRKFTLLSGSKLHYIYMRVFDVSGQLVLEQQIHCTDGKTEVTLSQQLKPGMYVVVFEDKTRSQHKIKRLMLNE